MIEQSVVNRINTQLESQFGRLENRPTWRVVWSEEQFEWRYGTYEDRTPEGFFIREVTERRRVPKYRQWAPEKWVLERLLVVPVDNDIDHPQIDTKLSYEPIWVFEENAPPVWSAIKFMVEQIYQNMEQHNTGAKYKDPDLHSNLEEAEANKEVRIKKLHEDLFGNETEVGDALAYRQGVGFTTSKLIEAEVLNKIDPLPQKEN